MFLFCLFFAGVAGGARRSREFFEVLGFRAGPRRTKNQRKHYFVAESQESLIMAEAEENNGDNAGAAELWRCDYCGANRNAQNETQCGICGSRRSECKHRTICQWRVALIALLIVFMEGWTDEYE